MTDIYVPGYWNSPGFYKWHEDDDEGYREVQISDISSNCFPFKCPDSSKNCYEFEKGIKIY